MFLGDTPNWGHTGAQMGGQILTCEARPGYVYMTGTWDLDGDVGREASRTGRDQLVRFVSIDMCDLEYDEVFTDWDFDDWGDPYPCDGYVAITANIAKITQCTSPAWMQAVIAPIDVELDMSNLPEPQTFGPLGLVASGIPMVPPAAWFENPAVSFAEFADPGGVDTMMNVGDDGRIYGHMALWDSYHIGLAAPTQPPKDADPHYPYYRTGKVKAEAEDGSTAMVRTGRVTLGTGHADLSLRHRAAAEHYDNTGSAVADVACGNDAVGIWFSGALRPGVTEEQIRVLRASAVSGDWRGIGGTAELVACLVVNVPGFPIKALAASAAPALVDAGARGFAGDDGEMISLVAAGMKFRGPGSRAAEMAALKRRLAAVEATVRPMAVEQGAAALGRLRKGA